MDTAGHLHRLGAYSVHMSVGAPQKQGATPEWRLGDRIVRACDHAGITQKQLGAAINVDASTLSKYIAGTREIRWVHLQRIAEATGVDLGWLTGVLPVEDAPVLTVLPGGRAVSAPERRSLNTSGLRIVTDHRRITRR